MNSQLLSPPRSLFLPPLPLLGDLWCYIYLCPSFILLLHLLVIHAHTWVHVPLATLSGVLVSCCGPHCTVQGSRPHKWGQGVNCGYLIRRWQFLLGLLFYHAPMVGPLGLESPLGSSRGLPRATWRLPLLWFWFAKDRVVLGSIFWQSGFPLFVLGHFFLLDVGLGLDMKLAEVSRSLWSHNSPSKSCCPAP